LTMFPATLTLLHQVLFENMGLMFKIFFIFADIVFYFALFILQYILASFSSKMHKMCKQLSRCQWKQSYYLKFKIKLQTYFERLSSLKRIGFSIGSITTMTFPFFATVSPWLIINIWFLKYYFVQMVIKYIRYFILVHKFGINSRNPDEYSKFNISVNI
jgi:hypothetical protein